MNTLSNVVYLSRAVMFTFLLIHRCPEDVYQ